MYRRPSLRRVSLTAWVLCTPLLGAAVSAPLWAEDAKYADTTDVVVVEVPITVTRGGEPVRGLTAADFEIKFDGKVQQIQSLEVIDLEPPTAGPADPAVQPPIHARRHFLFLFDLAFSQPKSIVRARKAARELVPTLHPSDLVAVALYNQIKGLHFLLGFTSDREQVDVALESFGLPELFHPANDPLQLYLGEGRGGEMAGGGGQAAGLSLQADDQIFDAVRASAALDQLEGYKQIERLAENFESMAQALAAVEGQVYIVYLSEGFNSGLILGNGLVDAQTRDDLERGRIWSGDLRSSQARYGDTESLNSFERMLESLRRSGAIVQSIDIAGLRAEGSVFQNSARSNIRSAGNADVLNAIAQDTGGQLYDNFNDFGDAMGLILDATSVTYLATLQPQGLPMDGEYRELKVRLKDSPGRGTQVSHRAGFFAPRPYELTDGVERRLSSAQLILGEEESGTIDFEVLAAVVPVAGETPYVPLLLEFDGKGLLASSGERSQLQLQLFAYAFDDEGQIQGFFTESVGLDLDKLGGMLRRSGLKYFSHLDLDPGQYRVRILVRDIDSGEYGVRTADVTVASAGPILLPVMVGDRLDSWVMARESASRRRGVPFPFVADGEPFVPRAALSLPRSGTTDVIVQAYGDVEGTLGADLTVRLADLDGNAASGEARLDLPAPLLAGNAPDEAKVARGTLETREVRRGVYHLELSAPGATESRIRVEVR